MSHPVHTVRAAEKQDIPWLEEMETVLFPDNCMGPILLETELLHGEGWIISVDDVDAGYLMARHDHDLLDITRVGVHPMYQRQGLGRKLLEHVTCSAYKALLFVNKSNTGALNLYEQLGFKIVGESARGSWVMRATWVDLST